MEGFESGITPGVWLMEGFVEGEAATPISGWLSKARGFHGLGRAYGENSWRILLSLPGITPGRCPDRYTLAGVVCLFLMEGLSLESHYIK